MGAAASLQTTQIKRVQEKVEAFPDAEDVTTLEDARKELVMTRNLLVDLYKLYKNEFLIKERSRRQKEKEQEMWVNSLSNLFVNYSCIIITCLNITVSWLPSQFTNIVRKEAERLVKESAEKAQAERKAKEAAEKDQAERKAKEAAEKAQAERLAK